MMVPYNIKKNKNKVVLHTFKNNMKKPYIPLNLTTTTTTTTTSTISETFWPTNWTIINKKSRYFNPSILITSLNFPRRLTELETRRGRERRGGGEGKRSRRKDKYHSIQHLRSCLGNWGHIREWLNKGQVTLGHARSWWIIIWNWWCLKGSKGVVES